MAQKSSLSENARKVHQAQETHINQMCEFHGILQPVFFLQLVLQDAVRL